MCKSERRLSATPQDDLARLIDRVEKLERHDGTWKLWSILATLVLALALGVGARAQQGQEDLLRAKTIEAEDFLLKGPDGKTRGELTMKDGDPVLQLYGRDRRVLWSTKPTFLIDQR